ncbi:MAG: hypothetical protein ACOC7V_16730 [Spirochaetota bacterium]
MSRPRALIVGLLAVVAATSFAQSDPAKEGATDGRAALVAAGDRREIRIVPAERELTLLIEENGPRAVVDLSLDEVDRILELRSVAEQQHDFIDDAVIRSFLVPGLGHYTSGARRPAVVFAAAAAAVDLATLVATYWLLPPAVQSRNLNYLQSSFETIEGRWKSISASELVPAAAATLSGGLLSLTVRLLAARDAEATALEAIEAGTVGFEPLPLGGVAR